MGRAPGWPGRQPGGAAGALRVAVLGLAVGAATGLVGSWPLAHAGFPRLLLRGVAEGMLIALIAVALFLLLHALFKAAFSLRPLSALPGWPRRALASGLALAPTVAWLGYQLNRTLGIRPSELTTAYALRYNLALLAAAAVLWVAVGWLLRPRPAAPVAPPVPAPPGRRGRAPAVALAALLLLMAGLWWFTSELGAPAERQKARTDVLVLLVDALRADHLGSYGYPRATSPAIDALAADGVVFEQAISASTFTKSSIASLFTGRYPYQHGVYWGSRRADPENPEAVTSDLLAGEEQTVAESFRDHGYLTAAWVQNSHLRGFMGFGQGFVQYHDQQGDIARIHRRFTRWLRGPAAGYPFFVYLHYIDLHDPYRPPPLYDTMFGERVAPELYAGVDFARWGDELAAIRDGKRLLSPAEVEQLGRYYDGQIRAIDDRIGELVAELKRRGLYDDTVIVLTADHGDALYEHGFIAHSTVPYEELARVPLIVKLPGQRAAGTRIKPQVRLVDVYPTLLDLAGIGGRSPSSSAAGDDSALAGCSLVPLIRLGERPPEMAGCAQAVIEIAEEGSYPVVAVRGDRYKYIHHQHRQDELYDLAADPGERRNLMVDETGAPRSPEELIGEPAELRHRALAAVAARGQRKAEEIQLDPETIRELQALGYL